jgi:NADH:ubiquinone oxidoreductase subunit E/NAD-dependent dihydropyrimidine dehydrogenase PreA subunit
VSKDGKTVGSVMVVGGGIGGMQASLDLAASGFKVYLLDRNPAIGGVMAQLDKTFPTNDCAMCTLAPRLVDTGQHINIERLTYSEVEEVSGSAGRFRVRVRKKARYVDTEKCTGCGECVQHCLVRNHAYLDGAIEIDLPAMDDDKKALVDRLVTEYPGGAEAVVPILQDINAELNWLPPEILLRLAQRKEVPLERILRIATFYKAFSLKPRGKTIFTVCMGTACHVKGAPRIVDRLERELGIGAGETTPDMKFTVETVRCIGCCGLAPVMTTGEDLFGRLDPARLPKLLKKYNGASP